MGNVLGAMVVIIMLKSNEIGQVSILLFLAFQPFHVGL